ncbi:hypothetical protein TWF730_006392 [Orbilia blumenaviensis]|uniref:Peptidase A1 domain-containing protein n=1 Tax=Orbilia blumenaviensis TaxID=1796055 RepID=A0AAV9VFN8_9PEZI
MKVIPLLLLSLPRALSLPQAYSDKAFEISTNSAADVSHITAGTIASADQNGPWQSLTTSHDHLETTSPAPSITAPISDHPSAHSIPFESPQIFTSAPGGAIETLSQQTSQPISPTHIDSHAVSELLADAIGKSQLSSDSTGSGADFSSTNGVDTSDTANEARDIASDITKLAQDSENEFLSATPQSTEPGFVPVYFAGGYFVAEFTIGSSYLLIKVDTSSFHFWVISNVLPDECKEATQAGSGCYKPDPTATPIAGSVGYTFRYRDGAQASGTEIYADNISAAGIFGAASWTKQVFALPSQLEEWDASSGMSGILPLGFNAKEYWMSKSSSSSTSTTMTTSSGSNSTEEILDESPLDITNWHFFTTYFKPGSQMFIGFDYEPKDLYEGSLTEVAVAPINGSWFVMPDSTWAGVAVESGSSGSSGSGSGAESTTAAAATPTDSGSGGGDASATSAEAGGETPASTAEGGDMTVSVTSTDTTESVSVTATESGTTTTTAAEDSTITETASSTDTESLSVEGAPNTQLVGTNNIRKHRRVKKRQDSTASSSSSSQYPILLDTGSKETLLDATTVKSIYDSLQGSCLTVAGSLHNCTFPCSFNYSNFAITPEYSSSIGLPWGSTTIPVDLTQFSSEVYDGCHPESGAETCSSTCRGLIQAQKPGKEYYIYGALVFKSAFFKWDTTGNGTVGMAPYKARGGSSWYYA